MTASRWFRFLFLLAVSPLAHRQETVATLEKSNLQPLEIRLAKPPMWKKYCLEVSIDLVNRSTAPIFLPIGGVSFASSVVGPDGGAGWWNVDGQSYAPLWDVIRLAPGAAEHEVNCIWDTSTVVNKETHARRQVRVLGILRISAAYYPEAQRWQISKVQQETMKETPPNKWKNADRSNGGWVTLEIPIPCPKKLNKTECATPPSIFDGETSPPIFN